jgi:molybdopterin-containing oxidoreductase family iron-sulfur binding subunit
MASSPLDRLDIIPGLPVGRRSLLKVMGASLALAGLGGCTGTEDENAYPYVNAPEGMTLGVAKWYATAVTFAGYAQPVLGKSIDGRPVKLEGNPDHPMSKGRTDAFTQAALLSLYDPGRSQTPRFLGKPADWNAFIGAMAKQAEDLDRLQGEGLRLLTGPATSPTLLRQIETLTKRWPKARWHVLDPMPADGVTAATTSLFGRPLTAHPAYDAAEVVVSFDDDFLGPGPFQTRNAGLFATRRKLRQNRQGQSHIFVAEPAPSMTGSVADRRVSASVSDIGQMLQALATSFEVGPAPADQPSGRHRRWLDQAAAALKAAPGKALVSVGPYYPGDIQFLALLINEKLGSFGQTLRFTDPISASPPDGARSFDLLAEDVGRGKVRTLVCLGANPAYTMPGRLDLDRVVMRIHAGLHVDETAALAHWHLPLQHDLESWGDARCVDGAISLIQPLVRPFYDVRAGHVVLDYLMGHQNDDRSLVQATWRTAWGSDFDRKWKASLLKGFVEGSTVAPVTAIIVNRQMPAIATQKSDGLTLLVRPDAGVWDGSLSQNAWAQETPRPITKITWGNVIQVSPSLARQHGLENGDEVELQSGGARIAGPIWIVPGQDAETVVVTLGYGRAIPESIADGLGYDAYAVRRPDAPWHIRGVTLRPTGDKQLVATTQPYQKMDGFDFVRSVDLSSLVLPEEPRQPSFYPDRPQQNPSWGMAIDLDLCIGCNACVTACQAENNIPVVGKDLIANGREMHWMRIDHYFEGDDEAPKSTVQPVPCMHCEQAPCEMGCPVNAAVHSIDGLNLQVYNRCIGTRTCSSYCPYKVRHFNWFDYTGNDPDSMRAMRNPDVTVRSRGVMEKCTYCVQRIAEARIGADKEGRPIRDGEVVTACQQACPSQAITFGNVADPDSGVSRAKADGRNYTLLEEANTRPRTTYLARIADKEGAAG